MLLISFVVSLAVLVVGVATLNSLRVLKGARRRRHPWNIPTECLVCQALGRWYVFGSFSACGQLHVQAAVDSPDLTGDVGRRVGGQEVDHPRDLLRMTQPAHRDRRPDP